MDIYMDLYLYIVYLGNIIHTNEHFIGIVKLRVFVSQFGVFDFGPNRLFL